MLGFPKHPRHRRPTLLATGTSKQRTSERVSSHEARIEGAIHLNKSKMQVWDAPNGHPFWTASARWQRENWVKWIEKKRSG